MVITFLPPLSKINGGSFGKKFSPTGSSVSLEPIKIIPTAATSQDLPMPPAKIYNPL